MNNTKFNKKVVSTLKYIYKVGVLKSIAICMAIFANGAEYEIKWKHRHIHLRKGTTDFHVFKQVIVFDQYNTAKLKALGEVKTIVDLGANIGLSALHFKMKYPNAGVIAVEPQQNNFDMLVKNVEGLPDVHCLNNAIWISSKNLGIHDIGLGEYGFVVDEQDTEEIGTVKAITMDDIINNFGLTQIDILKIDIEGSEKELFAGNYETWLPKVRSIIIELHDWFRPGCASSFFRAISTFDYTMSFKGENITILFHNYSETSNKHVT